MKGWVGGRAGVSNGEGWTAGSGLYHLLGYRQQCCISGTDAMHKIG